MKLLLYALFYGLVSFSFRTDLLAQATLPGSEVGIYYEDGDCLVRFHLHPFMQWQPPRQEAFYPPFDIFMTTNPAAKLAGLDGTNWAWVRRTGFGETNLIMTNIWMAKPYFLIGTLLDSDNDQLTDAYEIVVSHTDPARWDSGGKGLSDGEKLRPKGLPWELEQAILSSVIIYANSSVVTHGGTCGECTIFLPHPAPEGGTVVHYRFDGTASLGSDVVVTPSGGEKFNDQTLVISAGRSYGKIKLCAGSDNSFSDMDIYADITLTEATGFSVDNTPAHVNVIKSGLPGIRVFALPPWLRGPSHTYGTNVAGFYFIRDGKSTNALRASLSISGTAVKGVDYRVLPTAIVFPPNVRTNWLPLPIISLDAIADKTVKLTITKTPGYQADPENESATITIAASGRPPLPVVQVVATVPRATASTPGWFLFSRSGSTNETLRVFYDVIGDTVVGYTNGEHIISYKYLPGTVDIAAGLTRAAVPVIPVHPPSTGEVVTVVISQEQQYFIGPKRKASIQLNKR